MTFDPKSHLISMGAKGEYLEVKWRILWFRDQQVKVGIHTELLFLEPLVVFKATVISEDGIVLATGHGSAPLAGAKVWTGKGIEKAETAAIGRALAHAGYGTQFAPEDDEEPDTVVDSRVAKKAAPNPFSGGKPATTPPPAENALKANIEGTSGKSAKVLTDDEREAVSEFLRQPIGKEWKRVRDWLMIHVYDNKFHMDKSIEKWGKETDGWKNMTAGEVINYLADRHETEPQQKASGQ